MANIWCTGPVKVLGFTGFENSLDCWAVFRDSSTWPILHSFPRALTVSWVEVEQPGLHLVPWWLVGTVDGGLACYNTVLAPHFFFKPAFSPLAFHLTRPRAASHIFRKLLQSHTYSLILLSLRSLIFFFFLYPDYQLLDKSKRKRILSCRRHLHRGHT